MRNNILKVIIVVLLIVILGLGLWQFILKPKSSNEVMSDETTEEMNAQPTTEQQPPSSATYKNGTYSAAGTYQNPVSKEDVNITITLKDGVIIAATFAGTPQNATTKTMQNKFKSGFKELVVGKPIDEVDLTVVNGSSLTPKGFMDALSKVKTEAQG